MKAQTDIDFTTLNWVKQELDDTLKQARQALEAYVEDPTDKSQMRFCSGYLHQVQGTLRMVELYGAAMVVEEMERLAIGVIEGEIKQVDDAYTVLMRGMQVMPDYLERLQGGQRDIPIILLPLLNDLRACRGEKLLTETALFSPDLSRPLPLSAAGPGQPVAADLLKAHATKLRLAYQFGLLKWFKNDDPVGNLTRLGQVLDRLTQLTAQIDARRLWHTGAGVLEGVREKAVEASVAVKLLFGKVDREIKRLIDAGERSFAQNPPADLTRGLLYYAAHATGHGRSEELKRIYNLESLVPSQKELEHARGALTGHNKALLDTVGQNIKDDLLRVKDALDLFLRTASTNAAELAPQAETLHRVGDTLGMLGLGVPRKVVQQQREVLEFVASGKQPAEEQILLDVAGSLLYVESSLDDYIERLGQGQDVGETALSGLELPQAEVRRILDATMKEASVNIQQAKQDIVAFIESPWDHSKIEQIPRLMDEIGGALRMLNLHGPASLIDGVIRFTDTELLKHRRVPSADQLDMLADAMASIEYFLEAVKENRPNRDKILEVTQRSLESLGYWPIPSAEEADRVAMDRLEAEAAVEFPSFSDNMAAPSSRMPLELEPMSVDTHAELPTVDLPDIDALSAPEPVVESAPATTEFALEAVDIGGGEVESLFFGETSTEATQPQVEEVAFSDFGNLSLEPRAEEAQLSTEPPAFSLEEVSAIGLSQNEVPQEPAVVAETSLEPVAIVESAAGDSKFSWIEELAAAEAAETAPVGTTDVPVETIETPAFLETEMAVIEVAPAPVVEPMIDPPVVTKVEPAPVAKPVVAPPPAFEGFAMVPSDDIDDEIREVFVEEVQDVLNDLNKQYPVWKSDLNDMEKLKPIRRSFHTLKGSGRLVGALAIGEFSWKIENMLNRVMDKSISVSPPLLGCIDEAIRALPYMLDALRGEVALQGPGSDGINLGGIMWAADKLAAGEVVEVPKLEPVADAPESDTGSEQLTAGIASNEMIESSMATTDVAIVTQASDSAPAPEELHAVLADDLPESLALDPALAEILSSEASNHNEVFKAWLKRVDVSGQSQAISDEFLRAAHTLNGAVSMVELPVLSHVLAPLESYLKRLRSDNLTPSAVGVQSIREISDLVDRVVEAMHKGGLHRLNSDVLAAKVIALRDGLPANEPSLAVLTGALEELDLHDDMVEAPNDMSSEAMGVVSLDEMAGSDVALAQVEPLPASNDGNLEVLDSASDAVDKILVGTDWEPTDTISAVEADDPISTSVTVDESTSDAPAVLEAASTESTVIQTDTLDASPSSEGDALAEIDLDDLMNFDQFESGADDGEQGLVDVASEPSQDRPQPTHDSVSDEFSVEVVHDLAFDDDAGPTAAIGEAVIDEAEIDEAVLGEAIVEEAAIGEAAIHELPIGEAVFDEAVPGEAIVEEAAIGEAAIDEALIGEAVFDEAAPGEAIVEEAAIGEAALDEALIGEAVVDEALIGEAAFDEALIGELLVDEAVEATNDEAVVDEAVIGEFEIGEAAIDEALIDETVSAFDPAVDGDAVLEVAVSDEAAIDEAVAEEPEFALLAEPTSLELGVIDSAVGDPTEANGDMDEAFSRADEHPELAAFSLDDLDSFLPEGVSEESALAELQDMGWTDDDTVATVSSSVATSGIDATELLEAVSESIAPEPDVQHAESIEALPPAPAVVVDAGLARRLPDLDKDPEGVLDLPDADAELIEIFCQEGADILDNSDRMMAQLRDDTENKEIVVGLQRELHTLKGGARMAGITPVGDLSHAMESLFEAVVDGRVQTSGIALEALERAFDRMHSMVQRVAKRQAIAQPEHTIERLEAILEGRYQPELESPTHVTAGPVVPVAAAEQETAKAAAPQASTEPAPAAPVPRRERATALDEQDDQTRQAQEVVRVKADLLDNLVNFAGEVSIYRSRLEAQIGGFRFNLQEFEQTVTRLREQLRKLEMETEAQIIARYQREGEARREGGEFDPLELDQFSTMQQLSRALAESVSDLISLQSLMDDIARQSETLLLQQSRVSSELQEGLMRTRMVPFESLVPRLRRIIRQTAGELGKRAQLRVEGAQGEMDRTVLERMTAPLEHMLRNALAHGLESPEQRRSVGKNEEGTITINVSREATEVVIKVSDDGAGMNRDAIRRKAIERGLLRPDAQLGDRDLFQFVLEAGFSTAEQVSKVAGRGVGMDVVNSEIKQLGGSLQIDSTGGKGSVFTVRLPFTLSVTQAILLRLGEHVYAVPMTSVAGVMRLPRKDLDARLARNELELQYASETYQYYDLGDLLGTRINHSPDEMQVPILMTRTGDQRAAIRVSGVVGSKEVVVKSVGPQLSSVPGFFGATIMGDGSVVIILDLAPLVRHGVALRQAPELARELDLLPEPAVAPVKRQPLVMVVDDSITMRKVTTRVLERNDMEVFTAKDGLDAVEQLQDRIPDLMLLDIEMPRMDGYELATYVRNDPRLKNIPIIMITSRTGDKHRQRAVEIGVDRYLGKPYQEADLLRNVQETLKHGRTSQSLS